MHNHTYAACVAAILPQRGSELRTERRGSLPRPERVLPAPVRQWIDEPGKAALIPAAFSIQGTRMAKHKPPDAQGIDIRGTLDQEDLVAIMNAIRLINRKRPTEFYGITILGGTEITAEQAVKRVSDLTGDPDPIFIPNKRIEH